MQNFYNKNVYNQSYWYRVRHHDNSRIHLFANNIHLNKEKKLLPDKTKISNKFCNHISLQLYLSKYNFSIQHLKRRQDRYLHSFLKIDYPSSRRNFKYFLLWCLQALQSNLSGFLYRIKTSRSFTLLISLH